MSSRNYLLEKHELAIAAEIYQTLLYCRINKDFHQPKQLADKCFLKLNRNFKPEYFVIADEDTMVPLKKWTDSEKPRAFVSAYLSSVRLIDNLSLNN